MTVHGECCEECGVLVHRVQEITVDDVRGVIAWRDEFAHDGLTPEAFDAWLRQVQAEAWEAGEKAGADNEANWDGWRYKTGYPIKNPYEEAT